MSYAISRIYPAVIKLSKTNMGSISQQVKDSAIAGVFSARTQWLLDEITEFNEALRTYGHAIRVGGLKAAAPQRALAFDEALDCFGLLVVWNDKRLDNWFAWKMSDLLLSKEWEPAELDFFLRAVDDDILASEYYDRWHLKQTARKRQPVGIQSFQVLRMYLKERFKLQRQYSDLDIRVNVAHLDNIDQILSALFRTEGKGDKSDE